MIIYRPRPALAALAAGLMLLTLAAASQADVPGLISYQGRLTDSAGQPVPDGTYTMDFAVYGSATGGTAVWQETGRPVNVSGGVFTTVLGKGTPLPEAGLPSPAWLETKVGGVTLSPRVQLTSSPFALRSLIAEQVLPTGAVTSLNSIKGDVTLQAGDNISLSQSGNTITLSGLSIPNPLPVSQSGPWQVGITGSPSVNVANTPVVRLDPSQNTVKAPTQGNFIQLWTWAQTVGPGERVMSPIIDCTGYRELRLQLRLADNYSQPELIKVRVYLRVPPVNLLLGTADWANTTTTPVIGGNFTRSGNVCLLTVPVMGPEMVIEIENQRSWNIIVTNYSTAYLVN